MNNYSIRQIKTDEYETVRQLDRDAFGNPAVYQKKMDFKNYRELGIKKDDSVEDPDECIFAVELAPAGFNGTNRLLSYLYYDFFRS